MTTYYEKNKDRITAYNKKYYSKNRVDAIEYQLSRYNKITALFQEWRNTVCCSRCGENDIACIEFHHVDATQKEGNVARMASRSIGAVIKELNKCIVVCSNCHSKIHHYKIDVKTDGALGAQFEKFIKDKDL